MSQSCRFRRRNERRQTNRWLFPTHYIRTAQPCDVGIYKACFIYHGMPVTKKEFKRETSQNYLIFNVISYKIACQRFENIIKVVAYGSKQVDPRQRQPFRQEMDELDDESCAALLSVSCIIYPATLASDVPRLERDRRRNRILIRQSFSNVTRNLLASEFIRAFEYVVQN